MSKPVTIHSGERIRDEKSFTMRLRKIIAVCDALLNCKSVSVSDNNLVILGGAGTASALDIGQWDPAKAYRKNAIVFFTPDGEAAGTFYSLQPVAAGVSPDTGAPNWADFPQSPAGIWA